MFLLQIIAERDNVLAMYPDNRWQIANGAGCSDKHKGEFRTGDNRFEKKKICRQYLSLASIGEPIALVLKLR